MNTSRESVSDQDPDYVSSVPQNASQRKIYEENARHITARKITTIIEKEFSQEIDTKEKEIFQIQEHLHKALKSLHLLRYAIITDYYNRKQCQASHTIDNKQTQIHPAIKQLLGKAPKRIHSDSTVVSTSTEKSSDVVQRPVNTIESSNFDNQANKDDCPHPKKIPRYIPPKSTLPKPVSPSRGIHRKVRKRIIVGNLSKWVPPEWREDASSHKWMMYVRSSKDHDIGGFVGKVRFFLHPSYRPNDVVEITSSPFHLSRRGWGEFPIRVQLHFKNPLNKPMDVIHHLKLDKTYTGLQTLGSETVVDIWIYTTESSVVTKNDNNRNIESLNTNETTSNDIIDDTKSKKQLKFRNHDVSKTEPLNIVKSESKGSTNDISIKILEPARLTHEHDSVNIYSSKEVTIKKEPKDTSTSSSLVDPYEQTEIDQNLLRHYIALDHNYLEMNECSNAIDKTNEPDEHRKKNNETSPDPSESALDINQITHNSNLSNQLNSKTKQPCLGPLKISIPPTFEPKSKGKQVLVLKNKLVPMIMKKIDLNQESILKNSKIDVTKGGISVLKNSFNSTVLNKLNPSNTLLLNANYNVPALQIAPKLIHETTLCVKSNDSQISSNSSNSMKLLSETKENGNFALDQSYLPTIREKQRNEKEMKQKITLGKDKYKILSKLRIYEEKLKSIDFIGPDKTDTEGLIQFIIRRLPMITKDATDLDYKTLHPYACSTENEFFSYNIGKQQFCEWQRAKIIYTFMKRKSISSEKLWSIKEIIVWARLHGYTPGRLCFFPHSFSSALKETNKLLDSPTINREDPLGCTEPLYFYKWLENCHENKVIKTENIQEEDEIDIVFVTEKDNKSLLDSESFDRINYEQMTSIPLDERFEMINEFVCESVRDIGIKLVPEEIIPNVIDCTSVKMMVKAVECLIEDLVRRSFAKAWEREGGIRYPNVLKFSDVCNAILSRDKFDIFTSEGLGSRQSISTMDQL